MMGLGKLKVTVVKGFIGFVGLGSLFTLKSWGGFTNSAEAGMID